MYFNTSKMLILAVQMSQLIFSTHLSSSSQRVKKRLNATTCVITYLFQTVPGLQNKSIHLAGWEREQKKKGGGVGGRFIHR